MYFSKLATTYKRLEKKIKDRSFIIDFYEFNLKHDKIITSIQDCEAIIVVFDLNNRNSFEGLTEYWLEFIRNDCCYNKKIYILGNNFDKESPPLTSFEEITEMIKFTGDNVSYIEIGNKPRSEINLLLDELVHMTYIDDLKNSKSGGDCKAHSLKMEKCIVY